VNAKAGAYFTGGQQFFGQRKPSFSASFAVLGWPRLFVLRSVCHSGEYCPLDVRSSEGWTVGFFEPNFRNRFSEPARPPSSSQSVWILSELTAGEHSTEFSILAGTLEWCGREDSNLRYLPTAPQAGVCQFRRDRT
jgi:hypothetical protein